MSNYTLSVKLIGDINSFTRQMDSAEDKLKGFGDGISGLGKAFLPITAGVGLLGGLAVKTGIQMGTMLENADIGFETMLGSAERAKAFLEDLKAFAAKTPFEMPGLLESSKKLLAYGFAAKDVIPMLTSLGDAASGLGLGTEGIERLTVALGQMKAKGKVSAEEMRQLAEAGVPAWEMLADKIGVDIPTAMKMAEQGAISADDGIGALVEGMNKKFGGGMAKMAKTAAGVFSTIKDNIQIGIGEAFQKAMKDKEFMKAMNKMASSTEKIFKNLAPVIVNLAKAFQPVIDKVADFTKRLGEMSPKELETIVTTLLKMATVGPILIGVGKGISEIRSVIESISGIAKGFGAALGNASGKVTLLGKALNSLSANPIILVATAIIGLTAAMLARAKASAENNSQYKDERDNALALKDEVNELSEAYRDAKKAREESIVSAEGEAVAADSLADKLTNLANKANKTAEDHAKIQATVETLNGIFPDLGITYDEVTGKLSKSTDEIYRYIDAMKEKARAEAVASAYKDSVEAQLEAQRTLNTALSGSGDLYDKMMAARENLAAVESDKWGSTYQDILNANAELDHATEAYNANSAAIDSARGVVAEANNETAYYSQLMDDIAVKQADNAAQEQAYAESQKLTAAERNAMIVERIGLEGQLATAKEAQVTAEDAATAAYERLDAAIASGAPEDKVAELNAAFVDAQTEAANAASATEGLQGQLDQMPTSAELATASLQTVTDAENTAADAASQPDVYTSGMAENMDAATTTVQAKAPELEAAVETGVTDAASTGTEAATTEFEKVGEDGVARGIITGTENKADDVTESSVKLVENSADFAEKTAVTVSPKIGEAVTTGTAKGIREGIPEVVAAARAMARAAYDNAMAELNAASPSKKFKYVGKDVIAKGQAIGIEDGTPYVVKAITGMNRAVVKESDRISGMVNPLLWTSNLPATKIGVTHLSKLTADGGLIDYEKIGSGFLAAAKVIAHQVESTCGNMSVVLQKRELGRVITDVVNNGY